MYKIGTISQKNIFLPLFAYDIIFVEKAKTAKTFLGVFYKNFAKKVIKGQKGVFWYFSIRKCFINLSNIPPNTLRFSGSYCGKSYQGQIESQNFYPHFFQKGLFKRVKGVQVLSTRYFSRNVKNFHQNFFYDDTTKNEKDTRVSWGGF